MEPDPEAPPVPPLNLRVAGSTVSSVSIIWDRLPLPDLEGYRVFWKWVGDEVFTDSSEILSDTAAVIAGLDCGTLYDFAVVSADRDGNRSWFSRSVTRGAISDVSAGNEEVPQGGFALGMPYPNPLRGVTMIRFTVPAPVEVWITVADVLG